MKKPENPENEAERIRSLCRLEILDTPAEARFDRITRVAKHHFNVPIALVSLVDSERQWFKSRQGLDASETPRDISFCGHAILSDDIFYISNAIEDPRFNDNPLVSDGPKIRFYAGAPLHTPDGFRIGTLCIIDDKPREMSTLDLSILRDLADAVEAELERGRLAVTEKALASNEARIRAIVDTVIDGIITIDARGRVHTFNPAAEKIFGYTVDEVVGENVNMLMPEPYHHAHDSYLSNYLSTGDKKVIGIGREVIGLRKDGSTFPMELAVSEMKVDGARMFTGIVRDITERKRLERLKGEFISTVSHELRTPLTSICGVLGLVLGKFSDDLPGKVLQMLEMAERNSERLARLINDILDLEKIESGRLDFELIELDLVALARRAVEDNEGYARQHQVRLTMQTDLNTALIRGDEHRLLQVFANLISNAIKYSPHGDEVGVSVEARDGRFRVTVSDHGSGIPEAFRGRIFQRFAQADSSDTREKGGTGLGLSISKVIIERHEGQIDYESNTGEGSIFYFELSPCYQISQKNRHDIVNDDTGIRVLICEDNADVAMILSEMLSAEGVVSDIAASADAARILLVEQDYSLMLLDLSLPDVCGLELLQELRKDAATAELPVIVVSARAEEGRMAFTGDAMMVIDWLPKPLDRDRLGRALRKAIQSTHRPRILHVEDTPDVVQIMQVLVEEVANLSHVGTVSGAREMLSTHEFDLAIIDLALPDGSGIDLLDELKGHCPVIIFSGQAPDREITDQVTAALTKSMTSNSQLLATIKKVLRS